MARYDLPALISIIAKLRDKNGGCPWDLAQTHATLINSLLEETYEVIDAINLDDPPALVEELGDLLLQVVLHAQIAAEEGSFDLADVIHTIAAKMIRRHPHVFAHEHVDTVEDVLVNWEEIKKAEPAGKHRQSILDGVVTSLPALLKAEKVQNKAAAVGFQWDNVSGAVAKLAEELDELKSALDEQDPDNLETEFGDVLFSVVNVARYLRVSPELALNKATDKFVQRFKYIEEEARLDHRNLADMSLEEMDALWEKAKRLLGHNFAE